MASIYLDKVYKTMDTNEFYSGEYLEHNGGIKETKLGDSTIYEWSNHGENHFIDPVTRSYLRNYGIKVRCNYSQLFCDRTNKILCNAMGDLDKETTLILIHGKDYDDENETFFDIFQYFIIDKETTSNLMIHTNEIIYYHNDLDLYILGVTHCGTSWEYVGADFTFSRMWKK